MRILVGVSVGVVRFLLHIHAGRGQGDTVVLRQSTESVLTVSDIAEIPVASEVVQPANAQE